MKKICIFCTLLLCLLTGCSSNNQKEYPSVALLPGKGEVEAISLDQAIEMKENNESFLLIISQTYCTHCLEFFMESDPFTKEKGIKLWDVVLDDEKENKELLKTIKAQEEQIRLLKQLIENQDKIIKALEQS